MELWEYDEGPFEAPFLLLDRLISTDLTMWELFF